MTPRFPPNPDPSVTAPLSMEDRQVWQAVVSDVHPLPLSSFVAEEKNTPLPSEETKKQFRVVSLLLKLLH